MSSKIEEVTTYYSRGEIKEQYFKKNDKRHGEYKSYYTNGELRKHCFYKNGERHGEYKWFDMYGKLREHCFYRDNKLHGEYKWYHDNGELDIHCVFNIGNHEELSEYIEDPNSITDTEFMNLSMLFGNNFFASNTFTEAL